MKTFTIEVGQMVLATQRRQFTVNSLEEACALAIEIAGKSVRPQHWEFASKMSGASFVLDAWTETQDGREDHAVPPQFDDPDVIKLRVAQAALQQASELMGGIPTVAAAPAHPVKLDIRVGPPLDPDPLVRYHMDGVHGVGRWSDLVQANEEWDPETAWRIKDRLQSHGVYLGGGGAQPEFELRLARPGEED